MIKTGYKEPALPHTAFKLVLFATRPYKTRTTLFFLITFIGVVATSSLPLLVAKVVTQLGDDPRVDAGIWLLVGLFFAARLVDEVAWRGAELLMRSYKPQLVERIRTVLFSETLNKPHSYYTNSSSGRIGHWVNQVANTLNELIDNTIWTVWSRVIGLIIATIFLLFAHWALALLFMVWLVALFLFTTKRGEKFGQLVAKQSDETSKAAGIVVDSFSNQLSVRVFNAKRHEKSLLVSQQDRIIKRWRQSWRQNLVTNAVKGWSTAIINSLALALVVFLFAQGQVELGGIVLFVAYFGDASSSLWQLAWALDAYYRQFGTIQNALDGLSGENERTGEVVKTDGLPKTAALSLKNVSFAYADQPSTAVLSSLNIDIPAGQKLGVVGHSGAGKSTLIGLLLGFFEPTEGSVFLNEIDIASKDPSFIRAVSSYVPQDTNLFNRTISENIRYARPNATEEEVRAALQKAEALDFVDALPSGLDTLVGERGVKLSGGQRQRIAIARAILKDSPLLLLDEATSALDSVSEQSIQRSLHTLMKNRTAIVIAHRLSTLKHLDKIIVVEEGKIAEAGSHDELIKLGGIYADLWQRQKDGFIAE